MAYTPPSPTDLCNLALQKIECLPIDSIDNPNDQRARLCKVAFWPTFREVGRSHAWNCLTKRAELTLLSGQVVGTIASPTSGLSGYYPTPPSTINQWQPATHYNTGDWVVFNSVAYTCASTYTSGTFFLVDVSEGYWVQQFGYPLPTTGNAGGMYEWKYAYAMPQDYLMLIALNGNDCLHGKGVGSLYEIYASAMTAGGHVLSLYCNEPTAVAKYVAAIEDTTIYDALLISAFTHLLACAIVTPIKKDAGQMESRLRMEYRISVLPSAQLSDGAERKERRYDPTKESNFIRSRFNGLSG